MSLKIKRGNTAKFKFQRKDGDGNVILIKATKLYFTVKDKSVPDIVIFQKTLDDMTFDSDGTYHFTIEPEDTERMNFGTYLYDIKVIQGDIKATIKRDEFEVLKVVTFGRNEV